ncbi:MAG: hypothetical protein H7A51_03405 [Akkermansiaceae bacterium]|nr:hypothetical protein [Akkermansiaceae bacterium]
MKRESVNTTHANRPGNARDAEDWKQDDPVWDLLGKASSREPSAFFARNIVRQTRQQKAAASSWTGRLVEFFTPAKLALGAAACACVLAAYQMWPSPDPVITQAPGTTQPSAAAAPTTALTELVIEESLDAAAEDPTIFTRDEVVAMIGF